MDLNTKNSKFEEVIRKLKQEIVKEYRQNELLLKGKKEKEIEISEKTKQINTLVEKNRTQAKSIANYKTTISE